MAACGTYKFTDPLASSNLRFGFGLFQAPNNYLIMTSVSHENSSIASGLLGKFASGRANHWFGIGSHIHQYLCEPRYFDWFVRWGIILVTVSDCQLLSL